MQIANKNTLGNEQKLRAPRSSVDLNHKLKKNCMETGSKLKYYCFSCPGQITNIIYLPAP